MHKTSLMLTATTVLISASAAVARPRPSIPTLPPPNHFTSRIDNPWLPMTPGSVLTYRGVKDGHRAVDVLTVTHGIKLIEGIPATVVHDRLYEWTERRKYIAERTSDWYAQDTRGNVWYLGENTATLARNGHVISNEGTWRAGVNGARAGIFMPAHPRVGSNGYQEFYPGHAEDRYKVLRLNAHLTTPAVSSHHALLTVETTALEPGVIDHKYYIRGIGDVSEQTIKGGSEHLTLVTISRTRKRT